MSDSCICVSEYTGIHTTTLTLQINTANTDTEDTADTCLFTKLLTDQFWIEEETKFFLLQKTIYSKCIAYFLLSTFTVLTVYI